MYLTENHIPAFPNRTKGLVSVLFRSSNWDTQAMKFFITVWGNVGIPWPIYKDTTSSAPRACWRPGNVSLVRSQHVAWQQLHRNDAHLYPRVCSVLGQFFRP